MTCRNVSLKNTLPRITVQSQILVCLKLSPQCLPLPSWPSESEFHFHFFGCPSLVVLHGKGPSAAAPACPQHHSPAPNSSLALTRIQNRTAKRPLRRQSPFSFHFRCKFIVHNSICNTTDLREREWRHHLWCQSILSSRHNSSRRWLRLPSPSVKLIHLRSTLDRRLQSIRKPEWERVV